ncbi:acyltransferase [bacterium 0.1xD8-71]|nr:acyltransferase [bacterium 0.1xD8-71]
MRTGSMNGKRQANFELLRIVAMFMIITLHYLVKGSVAVPFAESDSGVNYFAWLIEAFCIVAVNCYVLISGYFMVESVWKPGRVVSLLCQVLFYALLIPCVMIGTGMTPGRNLGIYDWIACVLPIETEHYWFATSYLLLYLFAPFLAAGIRQLEKRQLRIVLGLLLCFFSLGKTIVPVKLVTDQYGYSFGWFLCLFVMAGYIRKYGIAWLEKKFHAVLVYVSASLLIWGTSLLSHRLAGRIDAFSYYENMPYTYNHLFCLAGAVALFYVFKNSQVKEGRAADIICMLAPYTFGIYLLHEHVLVRYEWMRWLGVEQAAGTWRFVPHMIGCVLLVYAAGTAVDMVRARLFGLAASWRKRHYGRKEI